MSPALTSYYTLSLHDALPIFPGHDAVDRALGQALELVRQHLLRARPRALGVRVVRAPHEAAIAGEGQVREPEDRKSTRLNSSHQIISYAVFCLKKKKPVNSII